MSFPIRHSLLILAATVLAGCGGRAALEDVQPSGPVQLDAEDMRAAAELLRMEDARVLDTALVARHLRSATPEIRGRAALAAGRVLDPAATPLLLRALADEHNGVRARAAFILGELGDSSAAVIAALGHTALHDAGAAAVEAAGALGRIGSERGRPYIDSLLTTRRRDALRHEALIVVWRLPRAASTLQNLAAAARDDEAESRWRAAYSLARTAGPAAVQHLLPLLDDDDARVRAHAVRGLRAPLADSANVRERALAAALAATRDADAHVRINAVNVLPAYRDNARVVPALVARLQDADHNVVIAAAQAVGGSADAAASAALRALALNVARPDGVRTAALSAWMRVDPAAAVPVAAQWADSTRWLLRMHAARALAQAPFTSGIGILQRLVRDPQPLVAADALSAIRTAADSTHDVRRIFVDALSAQHPLVRAAAISGIGRAPTPADLDLLLQAYERARPDTVRDAAAAAVTALGRLRRAGTPAERSFFLRFGQFGPPADAALYRTITRELGTPPQWTPAAPPEPRPLQFYIDIIERYVAPVLAGAAPPRAAIATEHGDIVLELAAAEAPLTVHNFLSLIDRGYYTGTRWHRVVPNFVIQDGDPRGDGSGGPGYAIRDEINPLRYDRGALGMALSGPDTGGSQWFITHSPQPHLDGGYTVFGRVVAGMDAVDRVVQEQPILSMRRAP